MARRNPKSRRSPKSSEKPAGKRPPKYASPRSVEEQARKLDEEENSLIITYDKFRPNLNYTISPRPKK